MTWTIQYIKTNYLTTNPITWGELRKKECGGVLVNICESNDEEGEGAIEWKVKKECSDISQKD